QYFKGSERRVHSLARIVQVEARLNHMANQDPTEPKFEFSYIFSGRGAAVAKEPEEKATAGSDEPCEAELDEHKVRKPRADKNEEAVERDPVWQPLRPATTDEAISRSKAASKKILHDTLRDRRAMPGL